MTPSARDPVSARERALTPREIGHAAALALHDELALAPKPGLVTLTDCGSHEDMDANTFVRSLFALRPSFTRFAELGAAQAPFDTLERCGIEAEARMLAATGGVNTPPRRHLHARLAVCGGRGARGLGAADPPGPPSAHAAGALGRGAGAAGWPHVPFAGRSGRAYTRAARRVGRGRSRLPGAVRGGPAGLGPRAALPPAQQRLDTLFHVIAALDDCNLAHRGGLEGLRWAQGEAARFIAEGGAAAAGAAGRAHAIGQGFVRRRLSPGGAADVLAATCWFDRLTPALIADRW